MDNLMKITTQRIQEIQKFTQEQKLRISNLSAEIEILKGKLVHAEQEKKNIALNFDKEIQKKEFEKKELQSKIINLNVELANYEKGHYFCDSIEEIKARLIKLSAPRCVIKKQIELHKKEDVKNHLKGIPSPFTYKVSRDRYSSFFNNLEIYFYSDSTKMLAGIMRSKLVDMPAIPDYRVWCLSVLKEIRNSGERDTKFIGNCLDLVNRELLANGKKIETKGENTFSILKNLLEKIYYLSKDFYSIPCKDKSFIQTGNNADGTPKGEWVEKEINVEMRSSAFKEMSECENNFLSIVDSICDKLETDYYGVKKEEVSNATAEIKESDKDFDKKEMERRFEERQAQKKLLKKL